MTFSVLAGLIALVSQAPLPAQPAAPALGEAYYLFIEGRLLEERGDIDGAIAAYKKATALAPGAAEVYAEMASLYAREGKADESIAQAQIALKLDASNREAHRTLGFVQAALADRATDQTRHATLVAEAIIHLERIVTGADPGATLTLGRMYVRGAQYDKAIATLTAFLIDEPGYPEALGLLADAYEKTSNWTGAASAWAELAAQNPRKSVILDHLGELYFQIKEYALAASAWDKALAGDRDGVDVAALTQKRDRAKALAGK